MAVESSRVYTVSLTRVSVSGAITLAQLKAGATVPLRLLRAVVGETSSVTSTQQPVQVNRKSAAATVTAYTPKLDGPVTDPASAAVGSTSGTGVNASAEGTDGDIIWQDVFNYLNGWQRVPTREERPFVDATGILGLKFPVAPASAITTTADMLFEDMA